MNFSGVMTGYGTSLTCQIACTTNFEFFSLKLDSSSDTLTLNDYKLVYTKDVMKVDHGNIPQILIQQLLINHLIIYWNGIIVLM